MTEQCTEVLYIGGWGRSGSTLLARMLGRIAGFVSVGEVRELWQRGVIENRSCGCGSPFLRCEFWREVGVRAYGGWSAAYAEQMVTTGRELDSLRHSGWLRKRFGSGESARAYLESLSPLYHAISEVGGDHVVVDSSKLPNYASLLAMSDEIDLSLVHLVRDSRGVANSWRKEVARPDRAEDPGEMNRYHAAAAAARYVGYNGLTELLARHTRLATRLRYEDLIDQPRASIETMLAALCKSAPADAFEWLDGNLADLGFDHTVDGNPMRMQRGVVQLKSDQTWRVQLPKSEWLVVTGLSLPMLWGYGYLKTGSRS